MGMPGNPAGGMGIFFPIPELFEGPCNFFGNHLLYRHLYGSLEGFFAD